MKQQQQALTIWAPLAKQLAILVGDTRIEATRGADGTWVGPALDDGADYAISLDGGPPRPDPRSRWQPNGVHGASRWIDPARFATDRAFAQVPLRDAVIYELHVGTFSAAGTFAGAIPHLGHLVELGVTHVEIMPVAQFSGGHGWGYDGVDLHAAHAPYGGPEGLLQLVQACHAAGLGVILDVVHNHLGPEGAYLSEFGPYKTAHHKTPWGEAINLDDDGSAQVRRFLIDSAIGWLRDYRIDGLRLDALHSLFDDSKLHFVAELVDAVRALEREQDRKVLLIGEYDDHDPLSVTERGRGGWGLDAHWNDDFHHAIHALVTGEVGGYYADFAAPDTLGRVLQEGYALDGRYSPFRKAAHGKPYGELPRDRLVAYVQSHDQVGNRAAGERLHQLCGVPRAKIAAALLLTSPFVPMLFQGEEWAASTPFCYFADLESAELREAVREGRKAEHAAAGWSSPPVDPTDPETRNGCVLRWDERQGGEHAEMLRWYRELIAVRKQHAELRDPSAGSVRVVERAPGRLFHVERGPFTLAVNLTDEPAPSEGGELVLASDAAASATELPPMSCALLRR